MIKICGRRYRTNNIIDSLILKKETLMNNYIIYTSLLTSYCNHKAPYPCPFELQTNERTRQTWKMICHALSHLITLASEVFVTTH